ncbi:MAG: hypothetical protein HZA32_00685 [Opitutae bacterium]|nr:hypothetical protein [Opitutae bacterium]
MEIEPRAPRTTESGAWSAPNPVRRSAGEISLHDQIVAHLHDARDGGRVTTGGVLLRGAVDEAAELTIHVATDAPVKFMTFKLRNVSERPRRLSVTGYWEWVLGELRSKTLLHVQTELEVKTGALLARNGYSPEFADRVVFLDVSDPIRTFTGDRREFLGRHGSVARPAALQRARLSGKVGVGLDPCGAMQVVFDLEPGQEHETTFRLGAGRNLADARGLIQRFRQTDAARTAFERGQEYWRRTLGAVHVETPDPAVNVMVNGWLLYQTLACRMWARTGFYQSGGAFGFRDQLQDAMALLHAEPALVREHLLRAAGRQFRDGDVQHWWHPPGGRGVRTHISDDYLWLVDATCRYVAATGDTGVLDEAIPFLEARAPRPEEESTYEAPHRSDEAATLYGHCVRALERAGNFGAHGLPLMGGGDWNDGMNLVGHDGRGESVWLAFFLHDVLTRFAPLARSRGETALADRCEAEAEGLKRQVDAHAWDGRWYLRAWFDDGTPLGAAANEECQIDALPQSWSVISGAGDPGRARQALRAVEARLVDREAGLVRLFTPPFDQSRLNPGYIKGYPPGVRENGGQYTHAAVWTAMAFALAGETERAWEVFHLLNPVRHGDSAARIATYRVEPYVVAADVYGAAPHVGRGGWTWYTGSAGWMYRLLLETLLGVTREGNQLRLTPRLPAAWTGCKIDYRHRETVYRLSFTRLPAETGAALVLDGRAVAGAVIELVDDGKEHAVTVRVS